MKFLILFLCASSLGFISCKTSNPPSLLEIFEEPIQLRSSIIEIPSLKLGNPNSIDLLDTLLVINDWYPNENQLMEYFTLVDIKNCQVINRFGKEGRGPNEFLQPFDVHFNKENRLLTTFAAGNQAIVTICLDTLLLQGNYHVAKLDMLSHGLFTRGIRIDGNDVVYAGIGLFENAKYRIIDEHGENVVSDIGNINGPSDKDYDNTILGMVFQGFMKTHPHQDKFVYCSSANDLIEIIDLKIHGVTDRFESYYPKFHVNNGQMTFDRDNNRGYLSVGVSNGFIYCHYSGRSYNEYGGRFLKSNKVFVFDWELKPVRYYQLDSDVGFIAVSEDDRYLYSVALIENDFQLIRYKMNH